MSSWSPHGIDSVDTWWLGKAEFVLRPQVLQSVFSYLTFTWITVFPSNSYSSPSSWQPKSTFIRLEQPWMREACAWVSTGGCLGSQRWVGLWVCHGTASSSVVSIFMLMVRDALCTLWHIILNLRFIRVFECIILIYVSFISRNLFWGAWWLSC